MNKKYIKFLKKVSKIDGFFEIQLTFLLILFYFLLNYIYWFFKMPNNESYNAEFKKYSGLLVMSYKTSGGGRGGGGGVIKKIVLDGDKGRIEFNTNVYSGFNSFKDQDIKSFLDKKTLTITHYNGYIVSCSDGQEEICITKCNSPIDCENFVIKKNRKECLIGVLICLFISVIIFLVASIKFLIEGKINV